MKIHHYTNLETLALILSSRKLRFNRLDNVDDLEEGYVESDGVKLGKYMFVSCWTENEEENIPLWKMYSGNGIGVRLSMEQDMFQDYIITNLHLANGMRSSGAILSKIPAKEFEQTNYFVQPIFDLKHGMFYRRIQYVDDVNEVTKDVVKREMLNEKFANVNIAWKEIGKYKHKRWAFQEESRFAIVIYPKNPLLQTNMNEVGSIMLNALYNGEELAFDSYYLDLKPEILDNMTITLNPSVTDAQKILVESLCHKYAPSATIKESRLKKNVKLK
jgi:hypothetical protein